MPNAPKTFRSSRHAKPKRFDNREPAHKRGYDWTWHKLRNLFLAKHPLCQHCEARGRTEPAREVDHITPFVGVDDPLRLQWSNLQSLCHSCHVRKTNREERAIGTLFIICGPPGSGKTTYVNKHKKQNDIVFDFDSVAEAMGYELYNHEQESIEPIEALRTATLAQQTERDRWVIYTNLKRAREDAQRHAGKLKILDTPKDLCIQRLKDANRPRLEERIEAVKAWWMGYEGTRGG